MYTIFPQILSFGKLQKSAARKLDRPRPDRDLRRLGRGHEYREYWPPETRPAEGAEEQ